MLADESVLWMLKQGCSSTKVKGNMILNREILHEAGRSGCGFNYHQLKLLGVPLPPKKGWLSALIGTEVSDETWQQVLQFKDRRKWQRREMVAAQTKPFWD